MERQYALIEMICAEFLNHLSPKYWDFTLESGTVQPPSFQEAERERVHLQELVKHVLKMARSSSRQYEFTQGLSKRFSIMEAMDMLSYIIHRIAAMSSTFYRYAPSNTRGFFPQRSLAQTELDSQDLIHQVHISANRERSIRAKKKQQDFLTATSYGRFTFEKDFPEVYEQLQGIFSLPSNAQIAILNSGMSAEVVEQLLIHHYIADEKIDIFDDSGRYYEHEWAKKQNASAMFVLNSRGETHNESLSLKQWEEIKSLLQSGYVLIRTDIVPNQEGYSGSVALCDEMIEHYHQLSPDEQSHLILAVDTTLYPLVNLGRLFAFLPDNMIVVTVSSLSKFHQMGFDIGGAGVFVARGGKNKLHNLHSAMVYSGFTPPPEQMSLLNLTLKKNVLEQRMTIIAENTRTMVEELSAQSVKVKSIFQDERFMESDLIGGLISIPKLGDERMLKLIQQLLNSGIQIDNRTSFGHNITAVEDVHQQQWSRISVGIENRSAIIAIAREISAVLRDTKNS